MNAHPLEFLKLHSDIIIAISVAITIALIVHYFRYTFEYRRSPQKYMRKYIEILYQAIKDEDKRHAYDSFNRLAAHIDIGYKSLISDLFDGTFMPGRYGSVDYVDWARLKEKFLKILGKYKAQISTDRDMSSEEIDKIINALALTMKKPEEVDCLDCGTIIPASEKKCPQCGWTWNN